jgi:hypothetical protein
MKSNRIATSPLKNQGARVPKPPTSTCRISKFPINRRVIRGNPVEPWGRAFLGETGPKKRDGTGACDKRILGKSDPQEIADAIYEAARQKDAGAIPAIIWLIGCSKKESWAFKRDLPGEVPKNTGARDTAKWILSSEKPEWGSNALPTPIAMMVEAKNNSAKAFETDSSGKRKLLPTPLYSHCCNAISKIILGGHTPLPDDAIVELARISKESANTQVAQGIYRLFGELGERRALPTLLEAAQAYKPNICREKAVYNMARSSLLSTEIYHSSGLREIEGPAIFEEAFARGKELDVDRGITWCMESLCRSSPSGRDTAGIALVALRLIGDEKAITPLKELESRLDAPDAYLKIVIHRLEKIRDGKRDYIEMLEGNLDMPPDTLLLRRKAIANMLGGPINWGNPTIGDKLAVAQVQEVANIFANPYAPRPR